MNIDNKTINNVLEILKKELVPAQGCTEPIAIAFTAAKAKEFMLDMDIQKVVIRVSGNIIC
ncbi:MAG: hypothetical protein U9Q33_07090 [Campylobacterota bacterium]|nr:hypothetical protein [Campylobacterota bacterium]